MMNTYIYSARLQRRRRRRRRRRRSNARVRRGYIKLLFVHMKNTRIARLLRFFKVNQLSSLKKIFSSLSGKKEQKSRQKLSPSARSFLSLSLSLRVLYFHTATRDRCCCSSYRSKEEEKEDARQKKRDGERKEGGR